jgi:hypothetical protein
MRGRSDSTFRDHIVIAHRLPARTWVTVHECQPGPRRKGDPKGPFKILGAKSDIPMDDPVTIDRMHQALD